MVTLKDIERTYMDSNVCIAETLADIPANNGSLEEAYELYMKAMNKVEGDHFFRLVDGDGIEVLTGDNAIQKSNALNELFCAIKFIDVVFKFDCEVFIVRVYPALIDTTHYDTLWDWWCFVSNQSEKHPNLNVEITGEKDDNDNISTKGIYVNVYFDDNDQGPKRAEVLKIATNI